MTESILLEKPVRSLIVPSSLLEVVDSLFQTCSKNLGQAVCSKNLEQCERNLSTASEQTCYNLFAGLLKRFDS